MKRRLLQAALLLGLIVLGGCAGSNEIVLYPITGEQIRKMEVEGVPGWWVSTWYLKNVMGVTCESK